MSKLTLKQSEEIGFLTLHYCDGPPTLAEIDEYRAVMAYGAPATLPRNVLLEASRALMITVRQWKQDIRDGLLTYGELRDDFDHPFANRLLNTMKRQAIKDLERFVRND